MKIKQFLKDFKNFAMQGDVLNLAVGVMIGGAFGKIVTSLVSDIFMPLIGVVVGKVDFSALSVTLGSNEGAPVLTYGTFLTNVIDFLLMALCVFLFVRLVSRAMPKKPEAPKEPTRQCPYCFTDVNAKATRCPNCTSELTPAAEQA